MFVSYADRVQWHANWNNSICKYVFWLELAKSCPIRVHEFVQPGKNWVESWIFHLNYESGRTVFYISIVQTHLDPNSASFELSDLKKSGIGHQFFVQILTLFNLSDSNSPWTRIFISPNFDRNFMIVKNYDEKVILHNF